MLDSEEPDSPVGPASPYARTKLVVENVLQDLGRVSKDVGCRYPSLG
jgi:UDP-glucose 4-epimerase